MASGKGSDKKFFRVVAARVTAKGRVRRAGNSNGFSFDEDFVIPSISAVSCGALAEVTGPGKSGLVVMTFHRITCSILKNEKFKTWNHSQFTDHFSLLLSNKKILEK